MEVPGGRSTRGFGYAVEGEAQGGMLVVRAPACGGDASYIVGWGEIR